MFPTIVPNRQTWKEDVSDDVRKRTKPGPRLNPAGSFRPRLRARPSSKLALDTISTSSPRAALPIPPPTCRPRSTPRCPAATSQPVRHSLLRGTHSRRHGDVARRWDLAWWEEGLGGEAPGAECIIDLEVESPPASDHGDAAPRVLARHGGCVPLKQQWAKTEQQQPLELSCHGPSASSQPASQPRSRSVDLEGLVAFFSDGPPPRSLGLGGNATNQLWKSRCL